MTYLALKTLWLSCVDVYIYIGYAAVYATFASCPMPTVHPTVHMHITWTICKSRVPCESKMFNV